jgi:multidrug transporter EmrE-like cation transporter
MTTRDGRLSHSDPLDSGCVFGTAEKPQLLFHFLSQKMDTVTIGTGRNLWIALGAVVTAVASTIFFFLNTWLGGII